METIAAPTYDELKSRHRAMWASGDYPSMVETFLLPLGPRIKPLHRIKPVQLSPFIQLYDLLPSWCREGRLQVPSGFFTNPVLARVDERQEAEQRKLKSQL